MSSDNTANVTLNCKLFWPCLTHKNELAGKYSVDLANLSDAAVTALEDMGLTVHNKGDERENYITCKSQNKFRVFNEDGSELSIKGRTPRSDDDDPNEGVVVGNGSESVCLVGYYAWEYLKKSGRSPTLKRITMKELVAFDSDEDANMDVAAAL